MAKESKDIVFATAADKIDFLKSQLATYRQLMTKSKTPSISFRYFFEDLASLSEDARPTQFKGEGRFSSLIDQVATMVFQTLSRQKVEFEFHKEQDFVNMGICMLHDVTYLRCFTLRYSNNYLTHSAKK